jgi:hypothetical protein
MNNVVSPLPLSVLLAFGVLAGCHSAAPVAANAAAPAASIIGNASSNDFGADVGSGERSRHTAQLVPSLGMGWSWDAASSTASFGPSATATAFSIECDADRDQLIFHRFYAAPVGGRATMSFTGNGHVASLPAATIGDEEKQESSWQAAAPPSNLTVAVAKVFAGAAPVEIAVSGSTELVTAPSPITQLPFAACHR